MFARRCASTSELTQKPQIIRPKLPDVVNRVHQHRDPWRPHPEGEAAELSRVIAAIPQHDWMHHPRPHDLQPTGPLAQAASLATADDAVHIHFDARLGEREVTGT